MTQQNTQSQAVLPMFTTGFKVPTKACIQRNTKVPMHKNKQQNFSISHYYITVTVFLADTMHSISFSLPISNIEQQS